MTAEFFWALFFFACTVALAIYTGKVWLRGWTRDDDDQILHRADHPRSFAANILLQLVIVAICIGMSVGALEGWMPVR